MSDTVAAAKLRAFIERVERIEADIADLNSDKSEVYKELRGEGYDVKTVRKIVAKRKLDSFEREEQDALFELYWDALHNGSSRVHVHEDDEQAAAKSPPFDYGTKALYDEQFAAANGAANETHERPSTNDEPSPEAGPQAEASLAGTGTGTLADREGRPEGEEASAVLPTHSPLAVPLPEQLSAPETVTPPTVSGATNFSNPRCQHPDTCHFAGTRESCHECLMAWSQRPRDEQVRLWAEANEAARAAT